MGNRNIVNGLAIVGAILVLVGVTIAANTALAEEAKSGRAPATTAKALLETKRDIAEKANRDAADDAAESIALDNELDLEIRLTDRTSTTASRAG